eukprot:364874-Prymnesium_polylepis.1
MDADNSEANELADYLRKWGAESEASRAVRQMIDAPDHYARLDLQRSDSIDENALQKLFRKKSIKLHPDKCKARGADDAFKLMGTALRIL